MTLADVRWIDIPHVRDERGTLTALEGAAIPFPIRRLFYMHQVPAGRERGAHAHRHTQQCLINLTGTLTLDIADGSRSETIAMTDPNRALYLPPMTWVHLREFMPSTVTLVLCDTVYEPGHVVRDWSEYLRLKAATLQETGR